ncbi:MAG: bifunctional diaminohydroxyphosphoribosylaminopyrimidine deaminase/5-amino-6-(5-phosphoribosylamino)uracil reductase RibD [Mucinivorans sp.]
MEHSIYMRRALDLALLGAGRVSPNPMVGAVVVHRGVIIGEGFHEIYGGPHAEPNAINSVKDDFLLSESTLYVTLEPCSHWGKTPPCAELILQKKIPKVVVGCVDPFAMVSGRGIAMLRQGGVDVEVGILSKECLELNRYFIVSNTKNRPYIILKYAQTKDGYIDGCRTQNMPAKWMTGPAAKVYVHRLRAQTDAIEVGRVTVEKDNPLLTVRDFYGNTPLRITIDRELRLPVSASVFDNSAATILFTKKENQLIGTRKFASCSMVEVVGLDTLREILAELKDRKIQSLVVEGGACLLQSFVDENLWDELQLFTAPIKLCDLYPDLDPLKGVRAPVINTNLVQIAKISEIGLEIFRNNI